MTAFTFRYVFRIGCGCRAEWGNPRTHRWEILHRCKRHPSGAIPVRTMARVYEARADLAGSESATQNTTGGQSGENT